MRLEKTEDYNEEEGSCLFISFSRDEHGMILGEPPDVYFGSGHLEEDFDAEKWTHFIRGSEFNTIFAQADPENFT